MSKIITLRPNRDTIRPVLMLLTSHRIDCILLCLRSLQRFTNLGRFKKIYVVANAVEPDHAAILNRFMHTTPGVEVIHCSPRGLVPAVNAVQNEILERHKDDVVLKLDEDVFVTPYWLDTLLAARKAHAHDEHVMLAALLPPVSTTGKVCLTPFIRRTFPDILQAAGEAPVYENPAYHELVWRAVLERDFVARHQAFAKERYHYVNSLIINCVYYDAQAIDMIGAFPCERVKGIGVTDELAVNMALRRHQRVAVIPSEPLVHHYSHAGCLAHMLAHVPVDRVERWLEGQQPPAAAKRP